MPAKIQPVISEKVKVIHDKMQNGQELTRSEKTTQVTKKEAAYLLSAIAGRNISPEYLKQLIFHGRLSPYMAIGNTYIYLVCDLLDVRFTKPHKKKEGKNETNEKAE